MYVNSVSKFTILLWFQLARLRTELCLVMQISQLLTVDINIGYTKSDENVSI